MLPKKIISCYFSLEEGGGGGGEGFKISSYAIVGVHPDIKIEVFSKAIIWSYLTISL